MNPRSIFIFSAALPLAFSSLVFQPTTAKAASFDCEKQQLADDEKAVCENRALNDLDVKMATTFDLLTELVAMGNRDTLKTEQTEWLKKRHACGSDIACIRSAYTSRQQQLEQVFKSLPRPL
ncbi:hypothetical protein Q2T52_23275 [Rhizobium oryzicola]|uniref:Lysozyme inhibitor LprI N-terminal domain-containing protein n=1 Tax=Rhizobium oryzicola TaxID=1232668 RepID=A0ABT8T4F1_9HYPH|nr:hypothetical protein [Rhizobium oryzicola]MDO1585023.1 hypothetical protein [Rhizobium oryzicola]